MTEKLKPCPFCGGEAEIIEEGIGFNIKCADCYAEMTPFVTDKREAIKMWNTRPIEDDLQKELDEAREDNCENMEYHVAERERLRALLKSCCNEFVPLDKRTSSNYPVCYRNRLIVDKDRHCTARGECPIYAELTKFDGSKDKPDGRLVELPNLKKAMAEIGDGDGKFSYPPLFPKK